MNRTDIGDRPRILISRLSHIGDCILTIPVANAIRDAYPNAHIAWAIESPGDRLIKECKAVDEVILVQKGWLKKPGEIWRLRSLLKKQKFDIAIDPQSLTKSSGISWISGARHRVGLAKPLGRELAPWLNNDLATVRARHVVDRSLESLAAIQITNPKARFDLSIPVAAKNSIREFVEQPNLKSGFAVINPGAGWNSRQWSNERFGKVAHFLATQHQIKPVVTWFGDTEEAMADEIIEASDQMAVKAPATRLWELGALIQQSRFYLGCDTGPTHLAAALEVPCITLFGTTEPDISGPYEMDPVNPIHLRIQSYYQNGSSRERRKAENAAMMEISIAHVTAAVDKMMSRLLKKKAA